MLEQIVLDALAVLGGLLFVAWISAMAYGLWRARHDD